MRRRFDGVRVEDSNVAGIGSQADKDLRRQAASGESAWQTAGTAVGLEIWRIEKFQVVPVAARDFGSFHKGDSYIILSTTKRPYSLKFSWDIFFWLGSSTSQDEQGTAAYKTVELDDHLGGEAHQHRETEGHESKEFLSLFKQIHYLEGGVDSGFHHVGPQAYVSRLLQVRRSKGRNMATRVLEVPLTWKSLNHGDSFVLDAGTLAYVWRGRDSSPFEKNMAATTAENLENERSGCCKAVDFSTDHVRFWSLLGGSPDVSSQVKSADEQTVLNTETGEGILLKLASNAGTLLLTEVARQKISHAMLESAHTFILDAISELYVWIGKGTDSAARYEAMPTAMSYLSSKNRPPQTPIKCFREGQLIRCQAWNKIMVD
eukprot:TRINITY_DN45459_c0_g1_i1.p1 TRINITY_DN45459_c0_g1~~TRINITY_DN45459_c0_g1_i1.p1  ORF type:complete len:375 (+),score=61.55 TRINITY_DN45459_c0_g1_i1:44-1168(+)